MPELTKLGALTNDYTGAYDERTRTFNDLRNLSTDDERRAEQITAYQEAAKAFETARAAILKHGAK